MIVNWVGDAEIEVLTYLRGHLKPATISEVIESLRDSSKDYRPSQLKIAALNLVSKGQATLDDGWHLSVAE